MGRVFFLCKIVPFSSAQPGIKFSSVEMARYCVLVLYVFFGPSYMANNAMVFKNVSFSSQMERIQKHFQTLPGLPMDKITAKQNKLNW